MPKIMYYRMRAAANGLRGFRRGTLRPNCGMALPCGTAGWRVIMSVPMAADQGVGKRSRIYLTIGTFTTASECRAPIAVIA